MHKAKKHLRFFVALTVLSSAFFISIRFSDRGVQLDLKQSSGASAGAENKRYNLSALKVLNSVLLHLKDSYVEPERINPSKMLVSALEEIQNSIPEVVIHHDGAKNKGIASSVDVHVGAKKKSFDVQGIASLWEMSFKLKEIFTFIETSLEDDPDIKFQDIEYAAINGMLSTLDPHSTLLPPQNYQDMQTQTGGKFGGLGIVISVRDGALTVISPIDGTPAAKQGIKSRDQIVRINDESTVNMDLTEAVGMMRGEPGTKVTLWVMRQGWNEPKRFIVERAIIKIESVDSQALGAKIGYLRIKNFQANTYTDIKKHLQQLREKMGGLQGLVLDMRDNPGGLLDQSIRISDLFLDEGTIVSTVGKGNKLRDKKSAMALGTEPKYPIIVLVNPGSASASEIVSGALQNNDRAVVLGNTTFGKGSVQVLYEFQDSSALKLTIAQYLTPGGISIQGKGISPDLRTIAASVSKDGVDMYANTILREGDIATALTNENTRKEVEEGIPVRYYLEQTKADEFENPDKFKEDFEIKLAQKLLVSAGTTWKRPALLKAIKPELDRAIAKENDQIQAELKKVGVDWSEGPIVEKPSYTLTFETDAKDKVVKAGESVKVTASLTNTGSAPLHQIKAITESENKVFDDREFVFGKVNPGQTQKWTTTFKLPGDQPSRDDFIKFVLSDPKNVISDKEGVNLTLKGQATPHFALSYEIDDPSKDGVLQVGEEVKFRILIQNTGKVDSAETLVYLKNASREAIYLNSGREKLKGIPAGKVQAVEFSFKVNKRPESNVAELEIDVYDAVFREFTQKKLQIPIAAAAEKVETIKGTATTKEATELLGGADAKSAPVALTRAKATLPVIARAGSWLKVQLEDKRTAWVSDAKVDLKTGSQGKLSGVERMTFFQKPELVVKASENITSKNSVELETTLKDDTKIKDYYIFVYNRDKNTLNTKKIVYQRVDKEQANFKLEIPLFEGMNRIAVFTRDEEGMTSSESAYVFKR